METLIEWMLKTSLVWGIGLLWYLAALRRQPHLRSNRLFLLFLMLIPPLVFALPAWWLVEERIYSYPLAGIAVSAGAQVLAAQAAPLWSFWLALFVAGLSVGLLRLGWGLWQLRQLLRQARLETFADYRLLRTPDSSDCYAFFGYIVIGDRIAPDDLPCVVEHEAAHRQLGHSRDLLLAELIGIFLWFNPLTYLLKKCLLEVHEYQADRVVLRRFPLRRYGDLLLQHAMNTRVSLFHPFSQSSQLKNRFMMMSNRNLLSRPWLYWMAAPVLCLAFVLLNTQTVRAQVIDRPDEMPFYGVCAAGDVNAVAACSNQNLMQDLGYKLKYPESARNAGKQGKVFVEFIVTKNGEVRDAKVIKSAADADLDAEALRVVSALSLWNPGKKDGKAVDVKMALPISFKLSR